tara:strand:- start:250 stop:648 length:399 start_codon:yes stop_codon:yes gene_type:complete
MSVTKELLQSVLEASGIHSELSMESLSADQRKVFGLLEAIDFGCFEGEYNCISLGDTTMEDVQQYIVENFDRVQPIPLPSALGFMSGQFDFLPLTPHQVISGLEYTLIGRLNNPTPEEVEYMKQDLTTTTDS